MPPPNLFLPFAPLPSFCFANYGDIGRFSSAYPPPATLWDPLNLSSSYIPTIPTLDPNNSSTMTPKIHLSNEIRRLEPLTTSVNRTTPCVGEILFLD